MIEESSLSDDVKKNINWLHERSQKTKSDLETHEAVCAERYIHISKSLSALNASIEQSNKRIQEEEINSVDTNSKFSSGTLVVHKKFGKGKIESVDGKKLTINFGNNGMRKVMENFVDIAT